MSYVIVEKGAGFAANEGVSGYVYAICASVG